MEVMRLKEKYPTTRVELCGVKMSNLFYAFVRPKSGEVYCLILPRVNHEVFSLGSSV
jgi:hypothetical protein